MIKKRNLDNSLIQWIMSVTSLGPGIGEMFWMAPAASSTSLFSTHLADKLGISEHLNATLAGAYAEVKANRNDVILTMPGAYDEAATLDWTKDHTHLIGLGGPVNKADYSEGNTVIYTDTSAIDYTVDLTGDHCQFINIGINNAGNHATSYGALNVNGYNNYFKNSSFIGNLGANQLAAVACGSLFVGTNGSNCYFDNCTIGEDCWGNRSGIRSGQLVFTGSQPNGLRFLDCDFRSASIVVTVAMVRIEAIAVGRDVRFKRCSFNNFASNATNNNQVFCAEVNDTTHSWTQIILEDCHSHGFDRWTDHSVDFIYGTMPVADDGGGQSIALDETVAGGS